MLARATYWLRGVPLPSFDNYPANRLLCTMLAREQEAEIVKYDYLVSAMAVLEGIPKEVFEQKTQALRDLKKTMIETVTHLGYDPIYQQMQQERRKKETDRQSALVNKLSEMGKKIGS